MLDKLSQKGKAGVVLANGSLSSNTSGEGDIRRKILEDDLVDCIVALPDKLFYTTGIPVCIWFFNREANTYIAWQNEDWYEDVQGYCKVASIDEIKEHDYILTPGRYVGIEEVEDDGEPFEEKMERLTNTLANQFKRSRELEEEIRKQLGGIGYEL